MCSAKHVLTWRSVIMLLWLLISIFWVSLSLSERCLSRAWTETDGDVFTCQKCVMVGKGVKISMSTWVSCFRVRGGKYCAYCGVICRGNDCRWCHLPWKWLPMAPFPSNDKKNLILPGVSLKSCVLGLWKYSQSFTWDMVIPHDLASSSLASSLG